MPPIKVADFKVTIDTDQPPADLTSLFADVVGGAAAGDGLATAAPNVASFRFACGPDVTILLSKNAGRYRLQSNTFEALWLLAQELVRRLRAAMPQAVVSFNEPLPLQEYFDVIDAHFACRKAVAGLAHDLEQRAAQFRAVQKRLLVRFKDRNPAPIANLDLLASGTNDQILDLADRMEGAQGDLTRADAALSCSTQLVNLLMKLRFELDEDNAAALDTHLSPIIIASDEQGWEERTDAALTYVLRTALAKSNKENAAAAGSLPPMVMPEDTAKLKKHITVLCDRLSKGGRFVGGGGQPGG